jgi:hypothetical protein
MPLDDSEETRLEMLRRLDRPEVSVFALPYFARRALKNYTTGHMPPSILIAAPVI